MSSSTSDTRSRQLHLGSSFASSPLEEVRQILMSFVQGLFHAAPLGAYHWDPEEERTQICIRDESPIKVETIGRRPAINFTMGNTQFYSLGMDDLIDYSFATGKKTKGLLAPGVTNINVCSRNDVEAHNLAWVVSEHIWLLREILLKQGFFEIGRGINLSPPSPAGSIVGGDQGDEWYCSSASIPWQFARTSAFTPLGQQVVNSIKTSLHTRTARHIESLGWPYSPTDLPYQLEGELPPSFAPLASDAHGGTADPAGDKSNPLLRVPHPLNPAKTVTVRVVRPFRAGLRRSSPR